MCCILATITKLQAHEGAQHPRAQVAHLRNYRQGPRKGNTQSRGKRAPLFKEGLAAREAMRSLALGRLVTRQVFVVRVCFEHAG